MARTTLAVPSGRSASFWSALSGSSAAIFWSAPIERTEKISLLAMSELSPAERVNSSESSNTGVSMGS